SPPAKGKAEANSEYVKPTRTTSNPPTIKARIAPTEPASDIHNPVVTTHPQPIIAPKASANTSRLPSVFKNRCSVSFFIHIPPFYYCLLLNKSFLNDSTLYLRMC